MTDGADGFDVERFVTAQDGTFSSALAELRQGRKESHWMWFVFPQLHGLGQSHMSKWYAISSLDEARAYLAHPLLGARLRECARVLAESQVSSAAEIFGDIDAMKLHSSMTLFAQTAPEEQIFTAVLKRFYDEEFDRNTEMRMATHTL